MKCIYAIRHIDSGKCYVGSAVDRRRRWAYHKNQLRNGKHHSQYLQNAWNLYGESAFDWIVIEDLTLRCSGLDKKQEAEVLFAAENYWVELHRQQHGVYNLRMVAKSNLGYKYSEESKLRMGAWQIGKKLSEQTKKKIAAKAVGRQSAMKGKTFSEDVRRRMSESAKIRAATPEGKARLMAATKASLVANNLH